MVAGQLLHRDLVFSESLLNQLLDNCKNDRNIKVYRKTANFLLFLKVNGFSIYGYSPFTYIVFFTPLVIGKSAGSAVMNNVQPFLDIHLGEYETFSVK